MKFVKQLYGKTPIAIGLIAINSNISTFGQNTIFSHIKWFFQTKVEDADKLDDPPHKAPREAHRTKQKGKSKKQKAKSKKQKAKSKKQKAKSKKQKAKSKKPQQRGFTLGTFFDSLNKRFATR